MRDSDKSVVVFPHLQNIRPQFLVVEERREKIDHGCHRSYVCIQGGKTILGLTLLESMAMLVLFAMDLGNLKHQLLLSVPAGRGQVTYCSDI